MDGIGHHKQHVWLSYFSILIIVLSTASVFWLKRISWALDIHSTLGVHTARVEVMSRIIQSRRRLTKVRFPQYSYNFWTVFTNWSNFIQMLLNSTRSICLGYHFIYTAVALEICYATRSENAKSWLVFDNEPTQFGITSKSNPSAWTKVTWRARASCWCLYLRYSGM